MEALSKPFPDAQKTYRAYRDNNSESLRFLRLIEIDWPCSTAIIIRLCEYLTDAVRINDNPVIFRAINYGLSLYSKSLGEADPVRLSEFIRGVIDSVGRDLENTAIYDVATNSVWSPLGNTRLSEWLKENERLTRVSELSITKSQSSAEDIAQRIFENVLDDSQRTIVSEELTWLNEASGSL